MPTGIMCCGAECGVVSAGAAGGVLHWNSATGTTTADTAIAHGTGVRSYKVTSAAGAANYLQKTLASPTILVLRYYLYFDSLPSADCRLIHVVPALGNAPTLLFQAASSKLFATVASGAVAATGAPVTTGQWYRVDMRYDVSGGTRTTELTVDGTVWGTASSVETASSFTGIRIGANAGITTANHTHRWDDLLLSTTTGDYPLGNGTIKGLVPTGDGTHAFNAAGDFTYTNTSNVALGATDTWTHVDAVPLTQIADFLGVNAASNVEYLEWTFGDLGNDVASINGLEVVGSFHAASTTANKTTVRLNDGGTLSDVATDVDFSNTTISYHTKHYATAPSGGAWTKTKVDALRARWNSSFGTVDESPVPFIDGLMLEVDYVPTSTTPTSTETGTLTDDRTAALTLTPTDTTTVADLVTAEVATVGANDSAVLGEAATAQSGGAPNSAISASDQVTLAEAFATTIAATPADAATLSDAGASTLAATPTEAGTLSEARTAALGPTATDAAAVAEAITALLAAVARSDSGLLTESSAASSANNFVISQSEAFTLADARTVDLGLAPTDLATLLGTVTGEQLVGQASETALLTEAAHAEAGPTFVAQALGTVAVTPNVSGIAGVED